MALALVLGLGFGVADRQLAPLGVALVISMIFGAYTQFSTRCPRCGRRIGAMSRLVLPRRCSGCGVGFRQGTGSPTDTR